MELWARDMTGCTRASVSCAMRATTLRRAVIVRSRSSIASSCGVTHSCSRDARCACALPMVVSVKGSRTDSLEVMGRGIVASGSDVGAVLGAIVAVGVSGTEVVCDESSANGLTASVVSAGGSSSPPVRARQAAQVPMIARTRTLLTITVDQSERVVYRTRRRARPYWVIVRRVVSCGSIPLLLFCRVYASGRDAPVHTGAWQLRPRRSCLLYTSPSPRDS